LKLLDSGAMHKKHLKFWKRRSLVKDRPVLHKQHRVDTAVVLTVVCDLGPATPDDLAAGGDEAEFGDVDFDDCAFCEDAELCVPEEKRSAMAQKTCPRVGGEKMRGELTLGSEGSS